MLGWEGEGKTTEKKLYGIRKLCLRKKNECVLDLWIWKYVLNDL